MSEYAELKARLRDGCNLQQRDGEIAAAAIDALERQWDENDAAWSERVRLLTEMLAMAEARAEAAEARVKRLEEALLWCSGSNDFNEGGVAREGWLKICAPLLAALQEDKSHD